VITARKREPSRPMNEVLTIPQYAVTTASPVSPAWPAETSSDFQAVALMLSLSMTQPGPSA